jgi:hypothetical protein
VRVDPARIVRNPVAPPVVIRGMEANGNTYLQGAVTLPAGTSRVQFDYVALSLTSPAANRYRYRLDGVDGDWVDAGNKRQASYTALGPGTFRFRVIAANPDGVWNTTGASMSVTIEPYFWQTWWFEGAVGLIVAVTLWALVQWRMRVATEATRQRIEDRLVVREHIAQELHDTLLQGFQGLVLRFQSLLHRLPPNTRYVPISRRRSTGRTTFCKKDVIASAGCARQSSRSNWHRFSRTSRGRHSIASFGGRSNRAVFPGRSVRLSPTISRALPARPSPTRCAMHRRTKSPSSSITAATMSP